MFLYILKTVKKSTNPGFTLIEMLVAVTVFALIVGATTGLLIAAIRSQVKMLIMQKLLDETSYVMEYMSRDIRMAKKALVSSCNDTLAAGTNYRLETQFGAFELYFITYQGDCRQFIRFSNSIYRYPENLPLISPDFSVSSITGNLSGAIQPPPPTGDYLQPRVTIAMTIQSAKIPGIDIKIQTTISQRNLDIQQ